MGSVVLGASWETLAGRDIGVFVVTHQDLAGIIEITREILCLPVKSHDAIVSADSLVVFSRHTTRVIKRTLTSKHHRALGGHDEDAAGMHQHGGFGVPVGLGPDVDAVDDQIDFAASLREGNQAT